MKLRTLLSTRDDGERAVSPVIGVILMVAITVILAAVIGTFVLGLGENLGNNAPTASFSFTGNDAGVTITVEATDRPIDGERLRVVGCNSNDLSDSQEYKAGSKIDCSSPFDGDEIRIMWDAPDDGQSVTLDTYKL